MGKKTTLIMLGIIFFGIVGAMLYTLTNPAVVVLHPAGVIAAKERALIMFTMALCLVVIVPVYLMLFLFAWRYYAGTTGRRYMPEWDHDALLETVWWGLPLIIIAILGVVTWKSSHELDPSKVLASQYPPLTIQVVSLPWKWLFIYPQQHIATVNYVQFPTDTDIDFQITSDAPMNSFWIPSLGGQIYAMTGMTTRLNLLTNKPGKYYGSSANISGRGFAKMNFIAEATPPEEFDRFVSNSRDSALTLDAATYRRLSTPSENASVSFYGSVESGLYNDVELKYLTPVGSAL